MKELAILLPLVAFVALAALTAIVLRRAGSIVARTREVDSVRGAVRDHSARVETSLEGATSRIDAVRRGKRDHRCANSPAGLPVGAMGATKATGTPFLSRTVVSWR